MIDLTLDTVEDAIRLIDPSSRDVWIDVGMSLKSEFGDQAFSIWDSWSQTGSGYKGSDAKAVWRSFRGSGITIGRFIQLAKDGGYSFKQETLTNEQRAEREQAVEARKVEQKKRQAQERKQERENARLAALRADKMWRKLSETGTSKYLEKKQVQAHGLKFTPNGGAVALMQDINGGIQGLQFLLPDGQKRYWPKNTKKTGHFHRIGNEPNKETSIGARMVVCEGYATGASIYESTGIVVFVAFDSGNLATVAALLRKAYPLADIIIAADDDYITAKRTGKNPGIEAAKIAAKKGKGSYVAPEFKNRKDQDWTDFNDLHVTESLDAVAACFILPDLTWQTKLKRGSKEQIKAEINNVFWILENDERWKGVLRYDSFTFDVVKLKPPPFSTGGKMGEWTQRDTSLLRIWLAEYYDFTPSDADTIDAVLTAADQNKHHPVLDYLHGLKWDGVKRLDTWMAKYLGADENEYTEKVGAKWMIGAIARVHATKERPVKMDNVLILEGNQGLGKSSMIATLAKPWSAETHFDLGSKDSYQQLRGIWIYELAELDAFNKAESTKAKAFFTTSEDNYRPSYGKRSEKFPRQCVFAGTTNQEHYMKDATGNRRYWPVRCTLIDLLGLAEVRDQLWAEALEEYRAGTPWWELSGEREIFHKQQEERFQDDVWESVIIDYLAQPENKQDKHYTTGDILQGALGFQHHQMKPPEQIRIGLVMMRIGWRKKKIRVGDKFKWVYVRPADELIGDDTEII